MAVIDIAYPIKTGRRSCLPWSLRSVQANLAIPTGRLFLFGPPQKGVDATVIRMSDRAAKAINLQRKYQGMIDSDLSDPFLLLDDDHIFLERTDDIRLRTMGTLPEHIAAHPNGNYGQNARNALELLRHHGLTERSYQVHYPLLIHKAILQRVLTIAGKTPVLMGSLYGNLSNQDRVEVAVDNKLRVSMDWAALMASRPFVSLTDEIEKLGETRRLLTRRFPLASRWEAPAMIRDRRNTSRRVRARK